MTLDAVFKTMDNDKDGYIGIDDLLEMKQELGLNESVDREMIRTIFEKISEEGDKIDKNQFARIFWTA